MEFMKFTYQTDGADIVKEFNYDRVYDAIANIIFNEDIYEIVKDKISNEEVCTIIENLADSLEESEINIEVYRDDLKEYFANEEGDL